MKKIFIISGLIWLVLLYIGCPNPVKKNPTEEYNIIYDANGADSGTVPVAQVKTEGVELTIASNVGSLAKAGYTFIGWNTSPDGTGDSYSEGTVLTVDEDLILYSEWLELDPNTTVTVNINGLENKNCLVYYNQHWSNTKNSVWPVTNNTSEDTQAPTAVFTLWIDENATDVRIGINVIEDVNNNGIVDWSEDAELGSFLLNVESGVDFEYTSTYQVISVNLNIIGDLNQFQSPLLITNYQGYGGGFPSSSFDPNTNPIEILAEVNDRTSITGSLVLIDDTDGNGQYTIWDPSEDPFISNEIEIDLLALESSYTLTLTTP